MQHVCHPRPRICFLAKIFINIYSEQVNAGSLVNKQGKQDKQEIKQNYRMSQTLLQRPLAIRPNYRILCASSRSNMAKKYNRWRVTFRKKLNIININMTIMKVKLSA